MDAAIYLLQQVAADDPENTVVLFKLGELAISAKNWAYAIEVLRRAADLRPRDVTARLVLMDVFRAYQMPIQEIMAAREILALEPRHRQTLGRLAALYEDQDMPEEEEQIRRRLAEVIPEDYPNLKRLAVMLEKRGETWEAALVYETIAERFPDQANDAKTLARLYGTEGDRYAEYHQWRRARRLPGASSAAARRAEAAAYGIQKRQLRRFDPVSAFAEWKRNTGSVDEVHVLNVNLSAMRPHLDRFAALGAVGRYRQQLYLPPRELTGRREIRSHRLMLAGRYGWRGNQTRLEALGGYEHIAVLGDTAAVDPAQSDPASFLFLEKRRFGGFALAGAANLSHAATPELSLGASLLHEPLEDLDAYVRLISKTGGTLSLSYAWPGGAGIEGRHAYDRVTSTSSAPANGRTHASLTLTIPLWISGAIRDRSGWRVGSLDPIPDQELRLGYVFDYLDDARATTLYSTWKRELRQTVSLLGRSRLAWKLHLFSEGKLGWGRVQSYHREIRAGLRYEDPESLSHVALGYMKSIAETVDQTQPARTVGKSRSVGAEFELAWQFGKKASPAPGERRRRK